MAKNVLADDSDYVYDPDHKHKPKGGHWEKTEKGWSQKKKEKKENTNNLSRKQISEIITDKNTSPEILEQLSNSKHPVTL